MKKIIIILLFCFLNTLFADLIHIPNNFSTIQSGINEAQNGDTILVQRGIYIENIDFKGKNIVVTSLFINSNDPEDIKQTIIDGDRRGTVVTIDKGETAAVLNGFAITNGLSWNGGGILCSQTKPVLKNLLIQNNEANNFGGGIELYNSNASIRNVKITDNIAHYLGGGLNCNYSDPYLENVTVTQNESLKSGGGISFWNGSPVFSNSIRCNVYLNTALTGSDLYVELEAPTISVVLDTFTVINPTPFFVEPINNFNFDILNSKIPQSNSDLYVSPSGDNNNSGLTPDQPLQTIGIALVKIDADSSNSHIIHLSNGTYSPSTTGEHFPLNMVSYVSIYGQTMDGVVIDAENQSNVLAFNQVLGSTIKNLTLTGGFVSRESRSLPNGGGIYCEDSNPVLENIVIYNNYVYSRGGGIFLDGSNATLINTIVKENNTEGYGGGFYFSGSQGIINNCLIKGNKAERDGGGIYFSERPGPGSNVDVVLENTTITSNSALMSGGGIFFSLDDLSTITFDTVKRCNIYLNHAGSGADFSARFESQENPYAMVFVDTFSVLTPTDFFASPPEAFNFNILNAKIEQVNSDLYVNPTGDNSNNGLTPDKPLKNISYALSKIISDSLNPKTIHLANGTYSPSVNSEVFPLSLIKYISLRGESQEGAILDADGLTNIMVFDKDSVISIENLTITGGNAKGGGGIYSVNSNFNLMNITLKNNKVTQYGGGIYFNNSIANMNNIIAFDNLAERSGGGVFCWNSNVFLKNSYVYDNIAQENGAGITIWGYCEPSFSDVTIYGNHALNSGGGLFISFASPLFNSENRCNIYRNTAPIGNDISLEETSVSVVLDTFTVLNPSEYYATPLESLTFDILHSVIQPIDSNLYVSPTGSNSNSGFSIDQPLKTISYALDLISADSLNPKTIFLSSGMYSPSTNSELFPLGMRDYVSLSGESIDEVILNAENKSRVITIFNNKGVKIENLTITGGFYTDGGVLCQNSNLLLKNLLITNNTATNGSGGINFISSNPELINVELRENTSTNGFGGAISFDDSDAHMTNVAILNNSALWNGGAIYCDNSNPILINVTISENRAGYRGGGLCCIQSNPFLINTILWNNWPNEVYFEDGQNSNIVTYSNVRGGEYGFITNNHGYVNWFEGNIMEAPLFVNPDSGNFNLQENSPLINKGTAFLVWEGDTVVNLPEDSYIGSAPDIGAFESVVILSINPKPKTPYIFSLRQNYPNPFNPETTIEYQIAQNGLVKIEIFDILGRKVKVLVDGYRTRGYHKEIFNANDFSSGIYFYKIIAGKFSDVKKMVLIK